MMLLSNCAVCSSKKLRFITEQEVSRIVSSSAKSFSKTPLVGPILFYRYKMNEKINKFLLDGDKFMPEMCLSQPLVTYSACGPFTKNKEQI